MLHEIKLDSMNYQKTLKNIKSLTNDLIENFGILNGAKHGCNTWIQLWKSNGMSEQSIENITKSDSNFAPTFVDHHLLTDMNFN